MTEHPGPGSLFTRRQVLLTAAGAMAGALLPRGPAAGPVIADHTSAT